MASPAQMASGLVQKSETPERETVTASHNGYNYMDDMPFSPLLYHHDDIQPVHVILIRLFSLMYPKIPK